MKNMKRKRTPAEISADKFRKGHPPQGDEPRRIIALLRITATEKRTWMKAAKAAGLGLGPWIAAPRRA
jgi:hypothetical protein